MLKMLLFKPEESSQGPTIRGLLEDSHVLNSVVGMRLVCLFLWCGEEGARAHLLSGHSTRFFV